MHLTTIKCSRVRAADTDLGAADADLGAADTDLRAADADLTDSDCGLGDVRQMKSTLARERETDIDV